MASLNGGEDLIPITFDVGTVGMQARLESGTLQNSFADRDFLGHRHPNPNGDNAQVCNYFHSRIASPRTHAMISTENLQSR